MVRQAHHERVKISMSPLFRFFALTYVVSWACFLAAAAVHRMVSTGGALPMFATALLLGLGVEELSMSPPAIPSVKDAVRAVDLDGANALASKALACATAAEVRQLLTT